MTKFTPEGSFRGVVTRVDRHLAQVSNEFQQFVQALIPPDLDLKNGDVVEVRNENQLYKIVGRLPYQLVERVRHPDVPTLWGKPVVDQGDAMAFNAAGKVYGLNPDKAPPKVETWSFESQATEAAYLNNLLLGGSEIPGVQLSEETLQKLSRLGVQHQVMINVASEFRRVSKVRRDLELEAEKVSQEQIRLRQDNATLQATNTRLTQENDGLTHTVSAKDAELNTLLGGITDAENEKARVESELRELASTREASKKAVEKERRDLMKAAQKEAKEIRDAATSAKVSADADAATTRAEAEEFKRNTLEELQETRTKAIQFLKALNLETGTSESRKNILKRPEYGSDAEIKALESAYLALSEARGTNKEQLVALHVGLKHTPFTVLAGPSGSGKTSLVLAYAQQLGIHVTTVAVQPGWRSVQDLHGYVNPLRLGEYRATPFFEALGYQVRQAQAARLREVLQGNGVEELHTEPGKVPLDLVLLDEINLSQVEYFLADYLSAFELESRTVALTTPDEAARLALQKGTSDPDDSHHLAWLRHLKGHVDVPSSFLIAGTANEDHTTLSFSDKFRDRAAFLRVEAPTLEKAMLKPKQVPPGQHYVSRQTWDQWCHAAEPLEMKALLDFSEALRQAGLPVSVRLFQRTARIAGDAQRLLTALKVAQANKVALDIAVSLGIAHKYGQLSEGRAQREQQNALRQALEQLLAGRTKATFGTLGWAQP